MVAKTQITGPQIGPLDLTTEVTGTLPVANGGTGSATQNFVDLTNAQTVGGTKTFSSPLALSQTASPSYARGTVVYDTSAECLTFFNDNSAVSMQLGQEEWVRVTNSTGSTITNGSPVYVNGGTGGFATIALAKADAVATSAVIGIVTADIANGATGYVTNRGLIHGMNTNAYSLGQTLYLSAASAGILTTAIPGGSAYAVSVGTVVAVSATVGIIYVQVGPPVASRVARDVTANAPGATPSINTDVTDQATFTGVAAAITSMTTNLTGTPVNGQKLMVRFKDNATARAITWGASFGSSGVATLLATTVISKTHLVGLIYDSAATLWICVACDSSGY